MRQIVDDGEPIWPDLEIAHVDALVECGHESPHVAKDKQPNNGHGDSGESILGLPLLIVEDMATRIQEDTLVSTSRGSLALRTIAMG